MLTRSIKQLEESLNVLLIERTSKSFRLTDAGRILYERAQEFLMQYEAIFQTMADVRSVKTGEVRLSIPGCLLDMYFPELFASFHRQYPGIDISLVEEGSSSPPPRWDWERRIWDWSCSRWRSRPALKATFWSAMCQLVVSREHPFAQMPGVHIRELRGDHSDLQRNGHPARHVHSDVRRAGLCPPHCLQKPDARLQLQDGGHQQCIALLPLPLILHGMCDKLVTTVPLEPRIAWDIAIIRRREGYSFAAARCLTISAPTLQSGST